MTPDDIREIVREELATFMLQDRMYLQKDLQLADGRALIVGGNKGTKLGQSTSKVAVFGVTPVVQANAISAPSSPGGIYSSSDLTSTNAAVNAIRTALKNFGITA